ncbi:hypothetical protein [Pelagibacterium limicola]|uniref:hypothetical protein n=1 Tax=Pelagibacterium limicola TaxID=2791022 RepID=UPI0018AFF696|nr:hypothetical protein [Pelagibacterium limicola]
MPLRLLCLSACLVALPATATAQSQAAGLESSSGGPNAGYADAQRDAMTLGTTGPMELLGPGDGPDGTGADGDASGESPGAAPLETSAFTAPQVDAQYVLAACAKSPDSHLVDILNVQSGTR